MQQNHYVAKYPKKGQQKQIAANIARQRLNQQGAVQVGSTIKVIVDPADTINSQSVLDLYAKLL